jgi:hypothetical protein
MNEVASAALMGMIDRAYAAALDADKWPDFLRAVSVHFQDASTVLWHTDKNDI